MAKEAQARVRINQMLEAAGWRFFDEDGKRANIALEPGVVLGESALEALGPDFEKEKKGFVDFLLLDDRGFPLVVLEAKSSSKTPLSGKEQARTYAAALKAPFIILSNGDAHYFWDLRRGNPRRIESFPGPEELGRYRRFDPEPRSLVAEKVEADYVARTQKADYDLDPDWRDRGRREDFVERSGLRFLRPYQLDAIVALQKAVAAGKDRFLFEMATGTGKTLLSAAVIKLFLRTGNARRVLFLVDRLELETQAQERAFVPYLAKDYTSVIYKHSRDDWRKADIVVSTVQTLLAGNRYRRVFKSDDFDLVISDEAHRSLGGSSRVVFEYFGGCKLGLTATPKDYLKNIDPARLGKNDPRELERRMLLDSYRTFGCESGEPTFRYSIVDGVRGGYLVGPTVVDARTTITAQLLSKQGYAVAVPTLEDGDDSVETVFKQTDFERRFFSPQTNRSFCRAFLEHGLVDPVTGEFGKSLVFCVSQNHAADIAQQFNELAEELWPGRYRSDFALQVTSNVPGAQGFAAQFAENQLCGHSGLDPWYKTSRARICCTVGMMTTGYDCEDLLNIALMRPIFSPQDFVQIKGRGTRKHDFAKGIIERARRETAGPRPKTSFKLFDFFANCEYFEEKFDYDEIIALPREAESAATQPGEEKPKFPLDGAFTHEGPDALASLETTVIGPGGMKIDRMYFRGFEEKVRLDPEARRRYEAGDWEGLVDYVTRNLFGRPKEFFDLERLRKALRADRKVSLREFLELVFGDIPYLKSREEVADEVFDRYDAEHPVDELAFDDARDFARSYLLYPEFRRRVESGDYASLNGDEHGGSFFRLGPELRRAIPAFIKDRIDPDDLSA
ncbi:MAG: DEAD/DEAH box helicase family protein [Rectinemataceae bacterium]